MLKGLRGLTDLVEQEQKKPDPLEVKVINEVKEVVGMYDSVDDDEYEDLGITEEQVKEFQDGKGE